MARVVSPKVLPMARVRGKLRSGFSTGTAAAAAARGALRHLLTGEAAKCVAVRLPSGIFFPVSLGESQLTGQWCRASVVKDGGDDPDVTHQAVIEATVGFLPENVLEAAAGLDFTLPRRMGEFEDNPGGSSGITLVAGEGVGIVTKPGLPVGIGEPAVNPVPRTMLMENLTEELLQCDATEHFPAQWSDFRGNAVRSRVHMPFSRSDEVLAGIRLAVEIRVPRGLELARRTLNPRLGIMGGISILGTTGLVKPFSHDAYRETIQAGLSVAVSNGCRGILLSTGGKSERFAREILKGWPNEAFVQIADFFAFALEAVRGSEVTEVVLSAFFGKAVKMAQGHPYTHAHAVPLDLGPLARQAGKAGYPGALCHGLEGANTAREALDLLLANRAEDLIRTVALGVLEQASRITGSEMKVRVLLFGYEGKLLCDLEGP